MEAVKSATGSAGIFPASNMSRTGEFWIGTSLNLRRDRRSREATDGKGG